MRNNLNNNYKFTQINNNLCSEETIVWDSEKKEWIIKINNNIFDIKENNNESDDIQKHDNKSMHILDSLISINYPNTFFYLFVKLCTHSLNSMSLLTHQKILLREQFFFQSRHRH